MTDEDRDYIRQYTTTKEVTERYYVPKLDIYLEHSGAGWSVVGMPRHADTIAELYASLRYEIHQDIQYMENYNGLKVVPDEINTDNPIRAIGKIIHKRKTITFEYYMPSECWTFGLNGVHIVVNATKAKNALDELIQKWSNEPVKFGEDEVSFIKDPESGL